MNFVERDFIDTLHCPYSGTRFSVHSALNERDTAVAYAIATSEAGDFPIVDGILRLRLDPYRQPLVDLIKRREPNQALLTALDTPFYGRLGPAINFLEYSARRIGFGTIANGLTALKRPMYEAVTDAGGTLVGTMKRLRTPSWATWQIQRFSMPHFLPVYPLLHLVDRRGPVLDFGCGGGHASFLMSRRVPGSSITCADVGFHLLSGTPISSVWTGTIRCRSLRVIFRMSCRRMSCTASIRSSVSLRSSAGSLPETARSSCPTCTTTGLLCASGSH
jgi:hypothetical protein